MPYPPQWCEQPHDQLGMAAKELMAAPHRDGRIQIAVGDQIPGLVISSEVRADGETVIEDPAPDEQSDALECEDAQSDAPGTLSRVSSWLAWGTLGARRCVGTECISEGGRRRRPFLHDAGHGPMVALFNALPAA